MRWSKKQVIEKVMFEDTTKNEIHELHNLNDDEFNFLVEPDEVTIL